MKTERIECNLCGSCNYEDIYRKKTQEDSRIPRRSKKRPSDEKNLQGIREVFKCNNCGLIFARQEKELKYYIDRYSEAVDKEYIAEEQGRRASSIEIVKRVEQFKKKGKLLDIGCANGFLLDEARRRKWEVYGIDLSKRAVSYAKEKLNLPVKRTLLKKAAFPDRYFDVVIMLDVIGHLTDPKYTLVEVRRILKDTGILYISAPNASSTMSRILRSRWWGMQNYYLYYFTKNTLEKMLDACGFTVKSYRAHIRIFSLNHWVKKFRSYSFILFKVLDFISRIGTFGKMLIRVNLQDQIEALAVKARKLDFLVSSVTAKKEIPSRKKMKVFVVLPAYNAEKTLKRTIEDIPKDCVDRIILVDDNSSDRTVEVAKRLGLEVYQHKRNLGYGANQKTCYKKALREDADIVIMVHPDYQYDPAIIPKLIEPIQTGKADAVFGSRMMKGGALEGGMPLWKHNVNILLTALENVVLGTYLTEYHTGFRAFSADLLKTVNFELNSDKFVFDTEIIVQALIHHFKIEEVPIQTRYFDEASKIKFFPSVRYGADILWTLFKYIVYKKGIYKFKQFE